MLKRQWKYGAGQFLLKEGREEGLLTLFLFTGKFACLIFVHLFKPRKVGWSD